MPQSPFLLLLTFKAHARHFPLAEGDREADDPEHARHRTNILSSVTNTDDFSSFSLQTCTVPLYDSLALSSPSSRAVLPLQPGFPSPSTAALPLNPSFLTPPRTGTLGSASPLPPASGSASTCPVIPIPEGLSLPQPLRSSALPARGTGGLSPLGRFSSARHVWVLCPAPTSFPHASSR